MRDNKVFRDADSAIESVIEDIKSVSSLLPQGEQTLAVLREAGVSILQRSSARNKNFLYVFGTLRAPPIAGSSEERNFNL
ncbi:Zinc finger hit domain-containing protein 2-like protein [Temnothorax longispinosus]|uniref:Zinc finger hit domain-containing protein 2-like protein n=1 Tax=Temnothorax longispinosus TaxID=300112 RepID=A0A4S2JLP1_9HYME|nr:Zinc finger hit domain-containing protein 2-like protein [Temnothorax longispinosus]